MIPLYDLDGTVCGIDYNGTAYYFYKNLQGDVIAITDDTGTVVAKYRYDAWGKCTIVSDSTYNGFNEGIATINPFRYRSYYYDNETGWYYLQSRYYDPNVGRFINADDIECLGVGQETLGCNYYIYCLNNPINQKDTTGKMLQIVALAIGAAFGVLIQYVIDVLFNMIEKEKNIFKRRSSIWDYVCAALSGALAATGVGKMVAMFGSMIISAINYIGNAISGKASFNGITFIITLVIGAISGLIGGKGANLKKMSGVISTSKRTLKKALSTKKILMYTNKLYSSINSLIDSCIDYIYAAVAGALGGKARDSLASVL